MPIWLKFDILSIKTHKQVDTSSVHGSGAWLSYLRIRPYITTAPATGVIQSPDSVIDTLALSHGSLAVRDDRPDRGAH